MDLRMRFKNIGKKLMKKNKLYLVKKQILEEAKKIIIDEGWNDKLFHSISKKNKFKFQEIRLLFPNGYLDLLKFYLEELNLEMIQYTKKLDLNKMKLHERIRNILIMRLQKNKKNKNLIKKTFLILFLPKHFKTATLSLYKTVDLIWFLAKDKSTDFNFYSKRAILAKIYILTIMHWINNKSLGKTINFLDKQLKNVSKIPLVKDKIRNTFSKFPIFPNFFNKSMQ